MAWVKDPAPYSMVPPVFQYADIWVFIILAISLATTSLSSSWLSNTFAKGFFGLNLINYSLCMKHCDGCQIFIHGRKLQSLLDVKDFYFIIKRIFKHLILTSINAPPISKNRCPRMNGASGSGSESRMMKFIKNMRDSTWPNTSSIISSDLAIKRSAS